MSSENPCIHAAFEEPCRCLQCFFGASKVKAETLISTGFLGFSSENARFYGFLPVFALISPELEVLITPNHRSRSFRLQGYFRPKRTFLFGACAAAIGVLRASTTGAAILK